MRFRLLAGIYAHKSKVYHADGSGAGNIIDTTLNLAALNGPGRMERKFELLDPAAEPVVHTKVVDLGSMTFDQLKSHAEEEEIDLKGAKSKEEALKVIRSQMVAA